ncbi:hypothetical protein [Bosea sp. TAB14]|jgi:antirestriction protein ArdC|uniref:hypothetical protein n=1 Tax=Bosea sp. TAB14 TaxID=3237481 RepID=UPI003F8FE70F
MTSSDTAKDCRTRLTLDSVGFDALVRVGRRVIFQAAAHAQRTVTYLHDLQPRKDRQAAA